MKKYLKYFPIITIALIIINIIVFYNISVINDYYKSTDEKCIFEKASVCLSSKNISKEFDAKWTRCVREKTSSNSDIKKIAQDCFNSIVMSQNQECIFEKAPECFSYYDLINQKYGFVPAAMKNGKRPYSFITHMFLHANGIHIFSNMIFLLIFGMGIEMNMGKKRYLVFYLLTGIMAAVFDLLFYSSRTYPGIGASGAIMGLAGGFFIIFSLKGYAVINPFGSFYQKLKSRYNFLLQYSFIIDQKTGKSYIYFSPIYFLLLFLANLIPYFFQIENGIGYLVHVGGFLSGIIFAFFLQKKIPEETSIVN